jgi:hypothetical protein
MPKCNEVETITIPTAMSPLEAFGKDAKTARHNHQTAANNMCV